MEKLRRLHEDEGGRLFDNDAKKGHVKVNLTEANVGEIETQLDNIEGMVGKYCQPEMGQAVAKIRKILRVEAE